MKYLADFPHLEEFDTRGNFFPAEAVQPITRMGKLLRLKLDGRYVSAEEARQMQLAMPNSHVHRIDNR
jgi:hypothetical protein